MHLHFLSLQKTKKAKAAESVSHPAASEGRYCSQSRRRGGLRALGGLLLLLCFSYRVRRAVRNEHGKA